MRISSPDFDALAAKIDEKKEYFEAYYELLLTYNERFNLTSVTEREEVFHKHFLDSVAGEGFFEENAVCAEVGSGAGFPSIPLKLIREDLTMVLIESTGKKCEFLRAAVRELGLRNVTVMNARAEVLAKDAAFREKFDVCFARAVARMNVLAEYCMPFVRIGGTFLAYKSDREEEQREARPAMTLFGGSNSGVIRYELPDNFGGRTLMFCQKIRPTPPKFPRGQGMERRSPIV